LISKVSGVTFDLFLVDTSEVEISEKYIHNWTPLLIMMTRVFQTVKFFNFGKFMFVHNVTVVDFSVLFRFLNTLDAKISVKPVFG